jgi:hypothetical protein
VRPTGRAWLLLGLTGVVLTATANGAQASTLIYWTNPSANAISFAGLESGGGALSTAGATVGAPEGLVIDTAHGRAYWANRDANTISWANLDGTGGGDLNTRGATVDGPVGLAIDRRTRVYWANRNANTISWANLDGTGGGDLNTGSLTVDRPTGVTVDPSPDSPKIYWTNDGGAGSISFAYLSGYPQADGSYGGGMVDTAGATVSGPAGVAVLGETVYWANTTESADHRYSISSADLRGGGGHDLDTSGATVDHPSGLALDPEAKRIYWTNQATNGISFANLDGTGGGGNLSLHGAPADGPAFAALLASPRPTGAGGPLLIGPPPQYGSRLVCNPTVPPWADDAGGASFFQAPTSRLYSWQRDGSDIPGATGTYPGSFPIDLTPTVTGSYTCRATVANQAGTAVLTSFPVAVVVAPPAKPPRLSRLAMKHRRFAPRSARPNPKRLPRGTTFTFVLDASATVTVRIERMGGGARALHEIATVLRRHCHRARNAIAFNGRAHRQALRPGRYRAVFRATNAAGTSTARVISFTIDH